MGNPLDDLMSDESGHPWSPMGAEDGKGGSLGSWDVIGNYLDSKGGLSAVNDYAAGRDPGKKFKDPFVSESPKDAANAQGYLGTVTGAYDNVKAPQLGGVSLQGPVQAPDAAATQVGPSAMGTVSADPRARAAQMAQMNALQQLAANGGRSAASDANLAQIQQQENQNARGQRDAALQSLARRGMSSSGSSLLASLSAGQGAADRQSARDLGVSGQEAQTALAAGQGAAGIGAGVEGQDFNEQASRAQAQDAINRFNSGQTTGVSVYNAGKNQGVNNAAAQANNQGQVLNNYEIPQTSFQDTMGLAGAKGAAAGQGLNYWANKYKEDKTAQGNLTGGAVQMGAAGLGALGSWLGAGAAGAGGGAAGDALGGGIGADVGAAAAASTGGRVPGAPVVPGDSPLNDIVPTRTSPGEVVVPRSLALGGSKDDIGNFVQHAPTVPQPGAPAANPAKSKEAILSALKHLRARRAV